MSYHVENRSLGSLEKEFQSTDPASSIQAYLDAKAEEGLELVSQGTGQAGLLFVFKGSGKKAAEHRHK